MSQRSMLRTVPTLLCLTFGLLGCEGSAVLDDSTAKAKEAQRSWHDEVPPADPPANQPSGPEFHLRALEDRAYAEGRGRDQQTHPEYLALTMPWVADYIASGQQDQKILHDPYRVGWGTTRGTELDVEFLNRRYGARMRAKMWGPATGTGPFPTLVFMAGTSQPAKNTLYTGFSAYEPMLQQFAESGYVVFSVAPQGQEGSEHFEPPHPMCDPNGAWKEPQELGLRELGECAGHHGPVPEAQGDNAAVYNSLYPFGIYDQAFLGQSRVDSASFNDLLVRNYDSFRHRMVFAALDGVDWLLSDANPWRARIDAERLGIVGHSGGADAALVVANGDPLHRFKAAASWDSYGLPPDTVEPRVPALVIRAEGQNVLGPYVAPPADHIESPYRVYRRFVEEGHDAMLVSLRGSTHAEWAYVPYALTNPIAPLTNASSKGGLVSFYYTLAWFDRWVKGGNGKRDAEQRLLARQFDGSADASSIGSGTWDPLTLQNVPYRLAGENVADHLSVLFLSQAHVGGVICDDLQAGCP
jgi:dienelactone hydrolase